EPRARAHPVRRPAPPHRRQDRTAIGAKCRAGCEALAMGDPWVALGRGRRVRLFTPSQAWPASAPGDSDRSPAYPARGISGGMIMPNLRHALVVAFMLAAVWGRALAQDGPPAPLCDL